MEIRRLRYFLALHEYGKMTRAAQELYISQQALSKSIRKFEEELEVPLFTRTNKGLALTKYGECLLPHAKKIVRNANAAINAIDNAKNEQPHSIRFGYVRGSFTAQSALPPSMIYQWKDAHPHVVIHIEEDDPQNLIQMINDGELDIAYLMNYKEKLHGDIIYTALTHEPLYIALSENHPLAKSSALALSDLEHEPVLLGKIGAIPEQYITSAYQNANYIPEIQYFNGSFNQCIEHVRMNAGILLAGRGYCQSLNPAGLAIRPFPDATRKITHFLLHKKLQSLPQIINEFVLFLKNNRHDLSGVL